jgi:hypothetical protein
MVSYSPSITSNNITVQLPGYSTTYSSVPSWIASIATPTVVAQLVKSVTDALNDHTNLPLLNGGQNAAASDIPGVSASPGNLEKADALLLYLELQPTYKAYASQEHVSVQAAETAINSSIETFISFMRVDGDAWGTPRLPQFEGALQGSGGGGFGDMEDILQNSSTHYTMGSTALHPTALQAGYLMEAIIGGAIIIGMPPPVLT